MDAVGFLNSFNWQTIIGMFVITWYFTHDIKVSLEKQGARTDKLYEMFCSLQSQMKDEIIELKKEQYQSFKEGRK